MIDTGKTIGMKRCVGRKAGTCITSLPLRNVLAVGLLCGATVALAGNYSPYPEEHFPAQLLWGDTHLHTTLSVDAYSAENRLSPEYAYRFARGETVISNTGQPVRMSRPLDFLVVSDHGEYLGILPELESSAPEKYDSGPLRKWRAMPEELRIKTLYDQFVGTMITRPGEQYSDGVMQTQWRMVTAAADKYNEPGKFTAFIGYEWTSTPAGNNLHRVVIFQDGADKANTILPFTSSQSLDPEHLWEYLQHYEESTGGKILAIPHNGNISNGLMFVDKTYGGDPLTMAYAETRARWEPLFEVTQIKGDSEAHPFLSPNDLFADYEIWDDFNFSMAPEKFAEVKKSMLQYEYARSALKKGLEIDAELGVNPFKFGMIGSTDSHIALSAVEENNFFGKFGEDEPSSRRSAASALFEVSKYTASGYAAVWAEENTRESIFAAMQRRETYATTGPRMVVRFFGGWDFDKLDHLRPDYAAIGYKKGVPMGGDLSGAAPGKSPRFLVMASKDPEGANLERIQIVKGWLDADGETHEKVYDVELSDDRKVSPRAKMAAPIKSTVDIKTATYTNKVGEAQFGAVWEDPDFNLNERAFYYVRVLEIFTPRWTTYDAAFFETELPEGVPAEHQERAYTSPIWYTP